MKPVYIILSSTIPQKIFLKNMEPAITHYVSWMSNFLFNLSYTPCSLLFSKGLCQSGVYQPSTSCEICGGWNDMTLYKTLAPQGKNLSLAKYRPWEEGKRQQWRKGCLAHSWCLSNICSVSELGDDVIVSQVLWGVSGTAICLFKNTSYLGRRKEGGKRHMYSGSPGVCAEVRFLLELGVPCLAVFSFRGVR